MGPIALPDIKVCGAYDVAHRELCNRTIPCQTLSITVHHTVFKKAIIHGTSIHC